MTTWRVLIRDENGGTNPTLTAVAPNDTVLDIEFNNGYGGSNGPHFLAWSTTHVYFPVVYDGAEWVGSAPRNPTTEGQPHVGGE